MRKRTKSSAGTPAKKRASRSPSPAAAAPAAPSLLGWLSLSEHVTFTSIIVLGLQLAFFFGGLSYIEFIVCGMRDNVDSMVDHPFNWALPINAYVQAQEDASPDSRSLLVTSLLMADTLFVMSCAIVAMYLILCADDITVIAAMLCNHSARALCFLLVELPKPERIIWRTPGFPDTENDYFFSGHIGLPIIAAMELWELGFKRTAMAFHAVNVLQVFLFIALQLHYSTQLYSSVSESDSFATAGSGQDMAARSSIGFHQTAHNPKCPASRRLYITITLRAVRWRALALAAPETLLCSVLCALCSVLCCVPCLALRQPWIWLLGCSAASRATT
jgi:hypothetical protein